MIEMIQEIEDLLINGSKENANKDSSLISTKKELSSGILSKHISLDKLILPKVKEAHNNNDLYIHDLSDYLYGSFNCCLFDMSKLLKNGFTINGVKKKQPTSIRTAIAISSDAILSASSQQFGGFTVPEVDKVWAPYCEASEERYRRKYKKLTDEQIEEMVIEDLYDELQGIEHRLNTINNGNGQTSFVTFSFGLGTSKWEKRISKAILTIRMKGLGENQVPAVFPKLVFLHKLEINGEIGSPNYGIKRLAIECSMKCMYPDWLSLDAGYLGEVFDRCNKAISPMGCRAFLSPYTNQSGEEIYTGRANFGAISLNLPRYAIQSKRNEVVFFNKLNEMIDLAISQHVERFRQLSQVKASSNPLFFCEGGCHITLSPEETIKRALETFTVSIGYIGLNEMSEYMTERPISSKVGHEFSLRVLKHIRSKVDRAKETTGLRFALYSTPAESLCYKFAKRDREDFGHLGIRTHDYYTNSYHVHVRERINIFIKQQLEKPFFDLATGGRIVYNEFPVMNNTKALEASIDHAMTLGLYYGVNLQLDTCDDCYNRGEFKDEVCNNCGSHNIISINRTCGYLGYTKINGDTRMNHGKMCEIKDRVDHKSQYLI